jgi:hypothetical protein
LGEYRIRGEPLTFSANSPATTDGVAAELGGGNLLAFEVRADAAPANDSARHLVWLRERLGKRFVQGVVFHTGSGLYDIGDRIVAVPIRALWR